MKEFKTYHPIVNLAYFVLVIGFSCVLMHPLCLTTSLVCGFAYSAVLKGKKTVKTNILFMLPMLIVMAAVNPAFNHEGVTIIAYLTNGNPLTLESILYGLAAAAMIAAVICWFSCFNEIMTSDKLIYLFGRIIPSLSQVLSMTLRFVPRFSAQLKTVANAQRCVGRDVSNGSIIQRARHGLAILSIMTTWALENAVDTADSMKARGFGLSGRTAFSIFKFDKRDMKALLCILILGVYVLAGKIFGGMYFRYFPSVRGAGFSIFGLSLFAAYLALCLCPIIIEVWEAAKWKALKSKI